MRCRLNNFLSYTILKEGIIGNIHVKLFEIWSSGSGGDVFLRKSLCTMDGRRTDRRHRTDRSDCVFLELDKTVVFRSSKVG